MQHTLSQKMESLSIGMLANVSLSCVDILAPTFVQLPFQIAVVHLHSLIGLQNTQSGILKTKK